MGYKIVGNISKTCIWVLISNILSNMLRCQYFDHSFAFQNWCQRLQKQPLEYDNLVTGKLLLLFLAVVEAFSATSKLDIFDHLDKIWSTISPILPMVATERGHFGGKKPKIGDFFQNRRCINLIMM